MQRSGSLTLGFERRAPDASGRYPVVVSTDAPVDMGDVIERLSHEPGAVNLSRFPLPLLFNHEGDKQVGIVENPSVTGGKLRATIRFASGQLANEIETDVKNGVRQNMSVGYYRNKVVKSEDERSGRPIYHTVSWQPYEASIVAVPADELAGVGRSLKPHEVTSMTNPNDARQRAELENVDALLALRCNDRHSGQPLDNPEANAVRAEVERVRPLVTGDGAAYNALRRFVLDARERESNREDIRTAPPGSYHTPALAGHAGDYGHRRAAPAVHRDHGEGNLCGLVRLAITGDAGAQPAEARAVAAANEQAGRRGLVGVRGGIVVPDSYWRQPGQRAAALTSDYSELVPTEQLGGHLVTALQKQVAVFAAGATPLQLDQPASIPAAGGLETHWTAENADVTESQLTTAAIPLVPHSLGVFTTASRLVMNTSTPDLESILRNDALAAIAAGVDAAALAGAGGVSAVPLGLVNHVGIGAVEYANGGSPDWADIVALQGAPEADNVPAGASAFIMGSAMKSLLMATPRVASSDSRMILDEPFDKMAGHRVLVGGNVPAGTIVFGRRWQDAMVAFWGAVELVVERKASSGQYSLGWHLFVDHALRRVESFAVLTEAEA
jgi:hypothetical protein